MKNILVIDDSTFYRSALRKELKDKNITIFEAKDGTLVVMKFPKWKSS